jgi:hypothetical protein
MTRDDSPSLLSAANLFAHHANDTHIPQLFYGGDARSGRNGRASTEPSGTPSALLDSDRCPSSSPLFMLGCVCVCVVCEQLAVCRGTGGRSRRRPTTRWTRPRAQSGCRLGCSSCRTR